MSPRARSGGVQCWLSACNAALYLCNAALYLCNAALYLCIEPRSLWPRRAACA